MKTLRSPILFCIALLLSLWEVHAQCSPDNDPPVITIPGISGAAPDLALTQVAEASDYLVVYEFDIPVNGNYQAADYVYAQDNSATMATGHSRVAYFLQLDDQWAWVSMDDFASGNLSQLGLPKSTANDVTWEQNVTNMNVYSNNSSIVTGEGISTGNIEIWDRGYDWLADNGIGGSNDVYDFDDKWSPARDAFGSFQIHNYGASQTILAYNAFMHGLIDDVGIGNSATANTDYTLTQNAGDYTIRKLYVLTNANSTPISFNYDLDDAGIASIDPNDFTTYVTDACSSVTLNVSPAFFDCTAIGSQTVTLTATDDAGNSSNIDIQVIIEDHISPTMTCPSDIVVDLTTGECEAAVAFMDPTFTDNCAFTSSPATLTGFTTIGDFLGNTYYISDEAANGPTAFANALAVGATMVSIHSAQENTFISDYLTDQGIPRVLIGFSDSATEGNFQWQDGSDVIYTNWSVREPNNSGGNEDYSVLFSHGRWNDINEIGENRYIVKISNGEIGQLSGLNSGDLFPTGVTQMHRKLHRFAG